jgi:hypothetical protein
MYLLCRTGELKVGLDLGMEVGEDEDRCGRVGEGRGGRASEGGVCHASGVGVGDEVCAAGCGVEDGRCTDGR